MMKKITLLFVALLGAISMNAQTIIFEDDFESYTDFNVDDAGDWSFADLDGLSTYGFQGTTFLNSGYIGAFIVFNATATTPPLAPDNDPTDGSNWAAHSGAKAMASFAAAPDGSVNANDDWLISPQITLVAANNVLTFWAKAANAQYSLENFNVGVSTTDTDPGSFTIIANNELPSPATEWVKYEYNLDDYAGQDVYIAINHVGSDQFGFLIDDFSVSEGALSIDQVQIAGFKHFYNASTNDLVLSADQAFTHANLYNILGQQVISQPLSSTEETINLSSLNTGVYLVNVEVNGQRATFKIVKR